MLPDLMFIFVEALRASVIIRLLHAEDLIAAVKISAR
jgi:hypothetical protein